MLRRRFTGILPHGQTFCTLWFDGDWGNCCDQHDKDYGAGLSRSEADLKLYGCVKAKGHPVMAVIMYAGVRVFGWIFYKKIETDNK